MLFLKKKGRETLSYNHYIFKVGQEFTNAQETRERCRQRLERRKKNKKKKIYRGTDKRDKDVEQMRRGGTYGFFFSFTCKYKIEFANFI